MKAQGKTTGFTLIELMIVVTIIGILASIAIPSYRDYTLRAKVAEAITLVDGLQTDIISFRKYHGEYPATNKAAGVPEANKIIGNFVKQAEIIEGAIHVTLGNKAGKLLEGKTLSIRPIEVTGSPASPISWICGNSTAPEGMWAVGENRTSVDDAYLPVSCRY